jgi:hypothetical protein
MCLSDGIGPVFVILATLSIQNGMAGAASTPVGSYLTSPDVLCPGA